MADPTSPPPPMDGELAENLDLVISDVVRISSNGGFTDLFKKDCTDLGRRISLLSHLVEEIHSRRLLLAASSFDPNEDGATKRIAFQFQCVTWKLEKALANIPYEQFGVSEEVQEQVELVRTQLKRATERYGGPLSCSKISRAASQPLLNELEMLQSGNKGFDCLHLGSIGNIDQEFKRKVKNGRPGNSSTSDSHEVSLRVEVSSTSASVCASNTAEEGDEYSVENQDESSKPESVSIPEDFLCPISLEIMRDPVIVATGQNNIEQPTALMTGKIKKSDGSFRDVSGDIAAIQVLVRKLSSRLVDERRGAVAEIRSLSKRSTDNRILIAEAGAIPVLVNLLTNDDALTQENAVTSILNLSIYENNKELIMLAGAIPSIVQVLRNGSMEARENAAATLFSLSLADENKIIIGASGAIPALVNLLQNGSPRGKKDAATALFNLCIYQGNKGRAVRAGIIAALMKMLTESDGAMVDEALTILSVLAGHQEAKLVIVRACTIPVLIDLLRTGLPRNKENAAAILLALCKRDMENLTSLSRLGAAIPLTEITKSGTERAKRKATSLLELLKKLQQQQN
uniref:RING-type E3 ubiquitin transferase n=1 Tax=Chenopodium quinoa TaxID=63459 RepID=A0A803LJQ4_CHEQI